MTQEQTCMVSVTRCFQVLGALVLLALASPVAAQSFYKYFHTHSAPVKVTANGSGNGTGYNCNVYWAATESFVNMHGQCQNGNYTSISLTFSDTDYILPSGATAAATIDNQARIAGTIMEGGTFPTTGTGTYTSNALTISWDANRGCATSETYDGETRTNPLGFMIGTQNESARSWETARYDVDGDFIGWDIDVHLMCFD